MSLPLLGAPLLQRRGLLEGDRLSTLWNT